ncbi:MAG: hypothetical protein CMH61_01745 [Nanoarchaeota archaeon]|nr:hypothetical protein [Nanoarchaeota archaeon]|tara:strand:- start:1419 stop:2021 length:603 start_codon:yes stop_codon:yes gene_type:complete
MGTKITIRAIIELVGKPKEHIERTIKEYVDKIQETKEYEVLKVDFSEIQKQDGTEFWATFAELELTSDMQNLTTFCFDYMPAVIEILSPEKMTINDSQISEFFNDLQARLHEVNLVAKQMKMQIDMMNRNTANLFRNYIAVLLGKGDLTSEQISKFTGVPKEMVEDYLDHMIDEGKVKMEGEKYIFVRKEVVNNGSEETS